MHDAVQRITRGARLKNVPVVTCMSIKPASRLGDNWQTDSTGETEWEGYFLALNMIHVYANVHLLKDGRFVELLACSADGFKRKLDKTFITTASQPLTELVIGVLQRNKYIIAAKVM